MVRRVGFGSTDDEQTAPSTAEVTNSRLDSGAQPQDTKPISGPVRVFIVIFIGIWLVGWSVGIIFAVIALFMGDDFSKLFLIFWIVLASGGWLFAVKFLIALLRGKIVHRGSKRRKTTE